jgi:hypothetical protein
VIVTGNNETGNSIVAEDIHVEMKGSGNFDFWQAKNGFSRVDISIDRSAMKFFPASGGTMFPLFTIPPADPSMTPTEIAALQDAFFSEVGFPEARVDTSRHPLMHTTPTVDYVLLLSGKISLLLDEGDPIELKPFDAVVQRRTNHFWIAGRVEEDHSAHAHPWRPSTRERRTARTNPCRRH